MAQTEVVEDVRDLGVGGVVDGNAAALSEQPAARLLVHGARDGEALEDHEILGERARLVREEVLDLAEVLVKVGGVGLAGGVRRRVVQLQVPLEELGADEPLQLDGHVHGHGHDVVEQVHEVDEDDEEVEGAVALERRKWYGIRKGLCL